MKKISVRLLLNMLGVSILAGLAAGLIVYRGYTGFIDSTIVSRLQLGVGVVQSLDDLADPGALETAGSENSDHYRTLVNRIRSLSESFGFASVYLMRYEGPGHYVFVLDTQYPDPQAVDSDFGKEYAQAPVELQDAVNAGSTVVTRKPYSDEFGTFRSAFVPIMSGTAVVAILGADLDISTLKAQSRSSLFLLLAAVTVAAGLAAGAGALISRGIARSVKETAAALDRVAAGDLTVSIVSSRSDEIGLLQGATGAMVGRLNGLVGDLRGAAADLASSSEQLSTSTQQLATGAQSQAATLEQTSAAVEELTASVQQVAEHAQGQAASAEQSSANMHRMKQTVSQVSETLSRVAQASTDSTVRAREGSTAVTNAAEAIRSISTYSEQIAGIVTVISDIADQTNLLALNASIEAARAGEHGRGFAVVAEEVSKLAERSSAATKEIEVLIRESVRVVTTGVETAHGALAAMEQIIGGAEKTTGMVDALGQEIRQSVKALEELSTAATTISTMSQSISVATEEQTTTMRQVASAIENVNDVTQQAASATEQMSGSTRQLSELAGRLLGRVEQFTLASPAQDADAGRSAPPAPVRSAARAA